MLGAPRRTLLASVLGLALGVALAGCGVVGLNQQPRPLTWSSGSPSPPPGPDDLINNLRRALMDDVDFHKAGLTSSYTHPTKAEDAQPHRPCETELKADDDQRHAYEAEYDGDDKVYAYHYTFSYWDVDAADVVAEIEKASKRCDSYRADSHRGKATYTVRSLRLSNIDGVEAAYAFCEWGHTDKWVWWHCYAHLARGKVLSSLVVNTAREKPARTIIGKLAPVAAELLVKAMAD